MNVSLSLIIELTRVSKVILVIFWEDVDRALVTKTALRTAATRTRTIDKIIGMKNLFRRYQLRLEDVIKRNIKSTT